MGLKNAFSTVFNAITAVAARRIIKRLAITGSVALLALLINPPTSVGQYVKLQNGSGTFNYGQYDYYGGLISDGNGPFTIDSIYYYEWTGSYTLFSGNTEKGYTPQHIDDGGTAVSCSYDTFYDGYSGYDQNGVYYDYYTFYSASFSYTKDDVRIKVGALSEPEACLDSSFAARFSFHLLIDGDTSYISNYHFVVSDAAGNMINSQDIPNWLDDTIENCGIVPTAGSYTALLTDSLDPLAFLPDEGLSYIFTIEACNSNGSDSNCIYQSLCSGLPWLNFDACYADVPDNVEYPPPGGTGWQGGGGIGVIQNSGMTIVNNFLMFNGGMSIDTVNTVINADGEFYVYTVLPGGLYSGPFKLGTGTWPAFGYSCNWILPATNVVLQSTPIAGFTLRIDSINFINGGVSLGATVHIPGITIGGACSSIGTSTSDISIAPIQITSEGIGGAIHVGDVSIASGFCVKDIFGSYYSLGDSLSFGADFKTPFAELGVSTGWKNGLWNAVGINYQQVAGGVPIGVTGMLLSGARGSASGWNNPPLQCTIGGTLDEVVPNTMRWLGDLSYQAPSTLTGSMTLEYLNVSTLGWQVVSNATETLDWNNYAKFSGSIQAGTFGNGYIFNGNGNLTYTWNPAVNLIGMGNGSLAIPKVPNEDFDPISDYINSMLPLQFANVEMNLKGGVMTANISVPIIGSAHLSANLNVPSIDFGRGTIPLSIAHPAGKNQILSLPLDSITVPVNTAYVVIRIRSNGVPSASTVIDPSNKSHTNAPGDSLVQYTTDPSSNHGFWLVKNPVAGIWKLSMPGRSATDTVDAEAEPMDDPLEFTASQVGKHITLTWTPLSNGDSADVTAYLDDSSSGYTGFLVATANDKAGTLSFDLNDSLPACQYYLYAARVNGAYISQSYASLQLDNSKTSALGPTNPTFEQLNGDTVLLRWTPTASVGMLGYVIKVTDANGVDSIYGSAYVQADSAVIVVQNLQNKHISIDAYGNGIQSCWSPPISAASLVSPTTDIPAPTTLALQVWPNPTTGKGALSFTLSDQSMVRVTICNVLGQEIESPVQGTFDAGTHTSSFDLSSLAPGTYYCRISANGVVESKQMTIER